MIDKRILHLVGTMKQRYGVTSLVMNIYRNIDRSKVQFDFLIHSDTEKEIIQEIESLGGKVYYMPNLSLKNVSKFKNYMNDFFKVNYGIYDIIHSHFNQIEGIVFPIAKINGVGVRISHSHSTRYSDSKIKALRNYLMCLPIRRNATHYFACSKDAGRFLFGNKLVNEGKVIIIKNAIDSQKFKYDSRIREFKRKEIHVENEIVIGNVGSLKKHKNHKFLIEIFYEMLKLNSNIKLVLVGDGELKNEILDNIEKYGLEKHVLMTGSKLNVNEYYQAFDLFVLPSVSEGFGLVLVEAQASGLPVLTSNIVPKETKVTNGIKYLPLSIGAKEWAINAMKLISTHERMDQSSEIKLKGYDLKEEAQRLLEIYQRMSKKEGDYICKS